MNYLAMLKAEFSENTLPNDLTKPTEDPSVSSGSTSSRHISGIEEASDGDDAGAVLGVGTLVSWQSPLFGRCHGRIAMIHDDYEWLLVEGHSVTKDFAFVSKHWDVQVQVSPS